MSRRLWPALAVLCLTGCQSIPSPESLAFIRSDGAVPEASQLEADRAACIGETAKATLGSTPMPNDNPVAAGIDDTRRQIAAERVMIGCMAAKGYKSPDRVL